MTAREFVLEVGRDMNKTETQMEPFLKKLEDEFIETVDDLKQFSDNELKEMGLPLMMIKKMKQKLELDSQQDCD